MTLELAIGAVSSVVTTLCVVGTFVYMRRGKWDQQAAGMTKLETAAASALQEAAEAKVELKHSTELMGKDIREANERITLLTAQFSMYRETAARELVNKELLREFELRIMDMQTRSENRLATSIDGLSQRFDKLIDAALRKVHTAES